MTVSGDGSRRTFVLVATTLALWLATASAHAQSLERARTLYLGADFEAARTEARAILSSSATGRADAVEALRLLVALESMLGTPESLASAAGSLVVLDASATPADGAPETATAAIEAARRAPRPSVALAREGDVVTATAHGAPSISAVLALSCATSSGVRGAQDPGSQVATLELEGATDVRCAAELRTASGIVIASSTRADAASSAAAPAERQGAIGAAGASGGAPVTGTSTGGGGDLPWILIGVGVGVVTIAVVIGAVVATSGSGEPTFSAPVVIGW